MGLIVNLSVPLIAIWGFRIGAWMAMNLVRSTMFAWCGRGAGIHTSFDNSE